MVAGPSLVYLAAAVLLVVAGVAKLADPSPAAGALRVAGLGAVARRVRAGAAVEVALGLAALVSSSAWIASVVGLAYLGFAAFVVWALVRGLPLGSCGCLGRADTRPSAAHVAVALVVAAAAVSVATGDGGALGDVFGAAAAHRVAALALVGVLAATAFAAMTVGSRRPALPPPPGGPRR